MTTHQVKFLFFKMGKFSHTEEHSLVRSGLFAVQDPINLRWSIPFSPIYFVLILKLVKFIHTGLEFDILLSFLRRGEEASWSGRKHSTHSSNHFLSVSKTLSDN
jgi:hypothetical protein